MSQLFPAQAWFSSPFRRGAGLVAALGLVSGLAASARASSAAPAPGIPSGVPFATVVSVPAERAADFVVLDAGFEVGFVQGAWCQISRAGTYVAEIELVALRDRASVALILDLAKGQSIRPGDLVLVSLFKPKF